MAKKINSEIIIPNSSFKLLIGTMDKKNPSNVYIEGGVFVEPLYDNDYKEALLQVEKRYKLAVDNIKKHTIDINSSARVFDGKAMTIKIFEIADNRLQKGKKSYLSFQFFLKQAETVALKQFAEENREIFSNLCDSLRSDLEFFGFATSKTKN